MDLLGFLAGKSRLERTPKANRAWQPQIRAGGTTYREKHEKEAKKDIKEMNIDQSNYKWDSERKSID